LADLLAMTKTSKNEAPAANLGGISSKCFGGAKSSEAENSSHSTTTSRLRFSAKGDKAGFTLMELIVAMVILAIVITGLLGNYFSSQKKGRDGKRKASLKQVQNALETYFNDNSAYPNDDGNGNIQDAEWGDSFSNPSNPATIYMVRLPTDPQSGTKTFFYEQTQGGLGYRLYALLENTEDSCFTDSEYCVVGGFLGINCAKTGPEVLCNFVMTSSNETP